MKKQKYSEIKRIEPKSLAKIFGIIYIFVGLIAGLILSIINIVNAESYSTSIISTFITIVYVTLLYALIGFVAGYVFSAVYNWVAKKHGGVKIEFG